MAIEQRKDRRLRYRVYWNNPISGKREHQSFATLAEARRHDSLIKHRITHERESFRDEQDSSSETGDTIREIISIYIQTKNFTGINLKNTLYHLQTVLKTFGGIRASVLDRPLLLKFIAEQRQSGVALSTANRRISILRAALSWAADCGLITTNPIAGVRLPAGEPERIPPPTQEETRAIMQAASPHLKRAIILSVSLGLRVGPSELLDLQWTDVWLESGIIRIRSAKKNRSKPYRDIPIRESLLLLLSSWQTEDKAAGLTHLITYQGSPVKAIKSAWKAALRRAGITRRIRPYDLRHAFASFSLAAGADLKTVADIMGHSDATMVLRHYQHVADAQKKSVVESVPDLAAMGTFSGTCEQIKKPQKACPHDKQI